MKNKINSPKVSEKEVIQCYKRYAPFYDWVFGKILQPGRISAIQEISHLNPENILEIGVGTGLMLPMYPSHIPVTGVDISREMLIKAEKKISPNRATTISLLEINGEELPFEDDSFSCIILPYTYSVTPNPERLIKEARRVCKKETGTIIILNHFSGIKSVWRIFETATKPLAKKIGFNSDFCYKKHIEDINWTVIKSYPVNILSLSRVVVISN